MILQMGNKGAFIRFEAPDLKPNIVTFSAVVGFYFLITIFYGLFCAFPFRQVLYILSSIDDIAASSRCETNGICK